MLMKSKKKKINTSISILLIFHSKFVFLKFKCDNSAFQIYIESGCWKFAIKIRLHTQTHTAVHWQMMQIEKFVKWPYDTTGNDWASSFLFDSFSCELNLNCKRTAFGLPIDGLTYIECLKIWFVYNVILSNANCVKCTIC